MKLASIATAMAVGFCSSASAQSATAIGTGTGIARSSSTSAATAIGGGNASVNLKSNPTSNSSLTINSSTPSSTTESVNTSLRDVPTAFAPGLAAAGLETCLGSVSGGGSALGWGASFGTTIPDPGCAARLDARTLWSMGLKKAAVARLCLTPDIYRSMPDVCAQYMPAQPGYVAVAVSSEPAPEPEYTGGPVQVRVRSTGEYRICNDYDVSRHRCRAFARD
jgi:hypothetical protein